MILQYNFLYYNRLYYRYKRFLLDCYSISMGFSFSSTSKPKVWWFTIIELLVALFIISLVILSIVTMINAAANHTNKIRQETIAINFAREGMEGMYTRRNTNWLKWPAEKDSRWLCTSSWCTERFNAPSLYFMIYNTGWEVHFENRWTDFNHSLGNDGWETSLFLLWEESLISWTNPAGWSFYRWVEILWLYQKDVNLTWGVAITSCNGLTGTYTSLTFNGTIDNINTPCWDNTAKELLFCSKVEYEWLWAWNGNVELCGSLTNYQE